VTETMDGGVSVLVRYFPRPSFFPVFEDALRAARTAHHRFPSRPWWRLWWATIDRLARYTAANYEAMWTLSVFPRKKASQERMSSKASIECQSKGQKNDLRRQAEGEEGRS
jgi:hypothetical protein